MVPGRRGENVGGGVMNDAFLHYAREDGLFADQPEGYLVVEPLATAVGLLAFIVYSTWAALQGEYYEYGPLSVPLLFAR